MRRKHLLRSATGKPTRYAPLCAMLLVVAGLLGTAGSPVEVQAKALIPAAGDSDAITRGAYLARLGNCYGCHTVPGDAPYAGGRAIPTDYGTFYAPNLTPDVETGIGGWSAEQFRRAMHEGRGDEGEPLYPVFPYNHFTRLSRADVEDLYAFLRSQSAVSRPNREHELRFPYSLRPLLNLWRVLFFRAGEWQVDDTRDARWNRGAYLVEGLAHCGACHQARNALGAPDGSTSAAGGELLGWYAPALDAAEEAGVAHWSHTQIAELLGSGKTEGATMLGPMAEIVFESLQYASTDDLDSMARYLASLPDRSQDIERSHRGRPVDAALQARSAQRGEPLYRKHCADCHGDRGEGRPPAAPALRGNRALTMHSAINPIRVVLYGGFAPATAGNPQPFGMPPFHATLSDRDIADILNHLRVLVQSGGAEQVPAAALPAVLDHEIGRQRRSGPLW